MVYKSQFEQDKYINLNYFKNKENGVFLDIGANDGVTFSNTYFFEKELNWTGICIEPIDDIFKELEKNRTSININGCAWNDDSIKTFRKLNGNAEMLSGIIDSYNEKHKERIDLECNIFNCTYEDIKVKCYNINSLLKKHKMYHIDFLSIDTEGSELEILKCIDFSMFNIEVILVENNYSDIELKQYIQSKGYRFIKQLDIDELYIKESI